MVKQVVEELGGLDFCHNNAGICINAPAEEMTYELVMLKNRIARAEHPARCTALAIPESS